jgi:hypothetical protein
MPSIIQGKRLIVLVGSFLFFAVPITALASIGVGIGTGKIQIAAPLKPGGIYELPSIVVLNTGDEPAHYEVTVQYQKDALQMWPDREWFRFSPQTFELEPGKVQVVQTSVRLPTKVQAGDYFGYLEAHPVKKDVPGQASIGIAAAAKLYFSIAPSNVFQAVYWRLASMYSAHYPLDMIIPVLVIAALLFRILGKRFHIQIARR